MKETEYLEAIVKGIVDHPEDVTIEKKQDEMGVLLTLKVNELDMGQLIGKKGETAQAIRKLINCFGRMHNARISLKIFNPRKEQGERKGRE